MQGKQKGVDLDNVSYLEFMSFEEEKFIYYMRVGLLMKPKAGDLEDIMNWNYGKVKELQMNFVSEVKYNELPGLIAFCYEVEADVVWQYKWHEVFAMYNHIYNEMTRIVEREKVLSYEPDADEEEAGVGRLAQFGALMGIDTLAGGNVMMWEGIEAKPYYLIFAKLHMESVKAKYIKNLQKIKSRKKT